MNVKLRWNIVQCQELDKKGSDGNLLYFKFPLVARSYSIQTEWSWVNAKDLKDKIHLQGKM